MCQCQNGNFDPRAWPLDQVRAAAIAPRSATNATSDESPLIIELAPPAGSLVNFHWIIEHLSVVITCTERGPINGTPVNGLFLCPPGTPKAETLLLAQGNPGIVPLARPIALPLVERGVPFETLPSGLIVLDMTLHPGFKTTMPGNAGWLIRAILNCAPGTASPGPGVGSSGQLIGTFAPEVNPS